MTNLDKFWHITKPKRINSRKALLDHLKKHDDLENSIYYPKNLSTTKGYQKYYLKKKTFDRVSFAKTTIENFKFRSCVFKDCILIGTHFKNCEFHTCEFQNTNTHKINISETYIDPHSFKNCLNHKKHQNIGVHLYQVLLRNSENDDQIQFQKEAQFLFYRWKRYQYWYEMSQKIESSNFFRSIVIYLTHGPNWISSYILEWMFGYGLRIRNFFVTVLCVIFVLSIVNYLFSTQFGLAIQDGTVITYWNALYYTVISLTTLGYGDIVPTTQLGRIIAAVQGITGFCSFAVLASMLYRKISP